MAKQAVKYKKKDDEDREIDWQAIDTPVVFQGRAITLPGDPGEMPIEEAIAALRRKQEEDDQLFDIVEFIDAYPLDAAVAVIKAMQQLYGWASPVPTKGFFGPIMPDMKTVQVGPGEGDVIQVPWGSFKVPGVENPIQLHEYRHSDGNSLQLVVTGSVRKKERDHVLNIVVLAKRILATESIYKGKAILISVDSDGDLTLRQPPTFIETRDIRETDLIHTRSTEAMIEQTLFTPLRHTAACRIHQVPLKRGILLEGSYGTGKSLTARVTAKVAIENGWTFIMLNNVSGLEAALRFASRYQPAVVFAEDIDRITSERDEDTNDLINTVDGVLSKSSEVITVLTTNHFDVIHPSMLRPGRLDAVIHVAAPDAESVGRLVEFYARGLLREGEDLTVVGNVLAGQIPATIREVVERAKLGMISRGDSVITAEDLVIAGRSMTDHLAMLQKDRSQTSPGDRLVEAVREVFGLPAAVEEIVDGTQDAVQHATHVTADMIGAATQRVIGMTAEIVDQNVRPIRKAMNIGR